MTMWPESSTPIQRGGSLDARRFGARAFESHRSPTAVSWTLIEAGRRPTVDNSERSDSMLAARCQGASLKRVAALSIVSPSASPSTTMKPESVARMSKHRSPSPSSAAPTMVPAGAGCRCCSSRCGESAACKKVQVCVGEKSPAPQLRLRASACSLTSTVEIPRCDNHAASHEWAAPRELSKRNGWAMPVVANARGPIKDCKWRKRSASHSPCISGFATNGSEG